MGLFEENQFNAFPAITHGYVRFGTFFRNQLFGWESGNLLKPTLSS